MLSWKVTKSGKKRPRPKLGKRPTAHYCPTNQTTLYRMINYRFHLWFSLLGCAWFSDIDIFIYMYTQSWNDVEIREKNKKKQREKERDRETVWFCQFTIQTETSWLLLIDRFISSKAALTFFAFFWSIFTYTNFIICSTSYIVLHNSEFIQVNKMTMTIDL